MIQKSVASDQWPNLSCRSAEQQASFKRSAKSLANSYQIPIWSLSDTETISALLKQLSQSFLAGVAGGLSRRAGRVRFIEHRFEKVRECAKEPVAHLLCLRSHGDS